MNIGLEADTSLHRFGDGVATPELVRSGANNSAEIHFAAFKEARAKHAVRGQAQAVASRAEWRGHGADETDPPARPAMRQAVNNCRPDAGLGRAFNRDKR